MPPIWDEIMLSFSPAELGRYGCAFGFRRLKSAALVAGVVALAFPSAAHANYYNTVGDSTSRFTQNQSSNPLPTNDGLGHTYDNTEGPIYDSDANAVLFGQTSSSHVNDLLWSYDLDNGAKTKLDPNSGGTQGTCNYPFLPTPAFVAADRDTRQITRRTFDSPSSPTVLANKYNTTISFNGPNDLVVDSSRGIYFTDPNFESRGDGPGFDGVYYVNSSGVVSLLLNCASNRPNGIALSPTGNTLYLTLYRTGAVKAYDITSPGELANTTGRTLITTSSPDGMTVDPWGNIIFARSNGISCISPTGTYLFDFSVSGAVTNVEIGGPKDNKSLFYTMYSPNMGLYSVDLVEVPEPASLAVFALPLALLPRRRRHRRWITAST
jgi:sugar lactone lactonase YvrE